MPKEKYSDKEWEIVSTTPYLTVLLMSCASFSGVIETKNELSAGITAIMNGAKEYPMNKLIASIVPTGDSDEEVIEKIKVNQNDIISKLNITNDKDILDFQNDCFFNYHKCVYEISKNHKGITMNEFKLWILSIAEKVAISAIEGHAFGQNTDPFSEQERKVFSRIKKELMRLS